MLKKLIIAGFILGLIGVAVFFYITSGEYESQLEKSEIVQEEVKVDSLGEIKASIDDLEGMYKIKSGEGVAAELLFTTDGLKNTKGAFEDFTVDFDIAKDYTTSSLSITIQTKSINTGNKMRDESLLEEDFFDEPKYPTIVFKSSSLIFMEGKYKTEGELTLNGSTNMLTIPFNHLGAGENEKGDSFEAFEGTFEFDRTEYGQEEVTGTGNVVVISFYCELEKK
jgi:polyisoprenoid-binding protein YceI